jgi:hypothetical protein
MGVALGSQEQRHISLPRPILGDGPKNVLIELEPKWLSGFGQVQVAAVACMEGAREGV